MLKPLNIITGLVFEHTRVTSSQVIFAYIKKSILSLGLNSNALLIFLLKYFLYVTCLQLMGSKMVPYSVIFPLSVVLEFETEYSILKLT